MPAASRTPRRRSTRRSLALFALLGALLVVLTGCSAPGQVKDYNEQTETNFLDACKAANGGEGMSDATAAETCGCWYQAIVDEVDFDAFKQDDENLRDAVDKQELNSDADFARVAPTLHKVVTENCIESGPTAN